MKTSKQPYRHYEQSQYYRAPYNQNQPSRAKRRTWPLFLLGLVVALAALLWHYLPAKEASAKDAGPSVKAATVTYAPTQADIAAMTAKINAVIAQYPNVQIAVSVSALNSGATYNYGLTDGYEAASVGKLITATVFLHDVETGSHSLQETVNGQTASYELQQMIEQSDNDAWQAFNDLLGHPALQAWAGSIGLTGYDANDNILTSKDVALLLSRLYQKKLLNADDTKLLLSYMQNANEGQYIVASVPSGVKVYHKAGWLDDRVHDAAIIDDGKDPYVLVIFTKINGDNYDTQVGQQIFQAITQATTAAFIKQ